jgi:hypothetical protein
MSRLLSIIENGITILIIPGRIDVSTGILPGRYLKPRVNVLVLFLSLTTG